MPREIIRPQYDEVCVFKLGFEPTLVEGIKGHQWQYFVNNSQAILYLDAPAKEAIDATGAKPGDEVALLKSRKGRSNAWSAALVPPEQHSGPVDVSQPRPATASELATQLRQQQAQEPPSWVTQMPMPPAIRPAVAAPQAPPIAPAIRTNGNGNGHHANGHSQAPDNATPPHRPGAKLLAMALFAAIDAAKLAQDYATSHGLNIRFTSEDIRTMANTLRMEERQK